MIEIRPIRRLNEERLVWGMLPTPWMFAYGGFVMLVAMFYFPGNVGEAIVTFSILAAGMAFMKAIHAVSRTKIIPHWVRWNMAESGALLGRDTNPVPHRYQDVDEATNAYIREQVSLDRKRTQQWKQFRNQYRQQQQRQFNQEKKAISQAEKRSAQSVRKGRTVGRGRAS